MTFSQPPEPALAGPAAKQADRRSTRLIWRRWWRQQSPARQDRFATLGPLVSVMLFLAAIVAAFWYLRNEEFDRERESVKRDTEVVQQQIRLRLIENQEQLVRIAREVATRTIDQGQFLGRVLPFLRQAFFELGAPGLQPGQGVLQLRAFLGQGRQLGHAGLGRGAALGLGASAGFACLAAIVQRAMFLLGALMQQALRLQASPQRNRDQGQNARRRPTDGQSHRRCVVHVDSCCHRPDRRVTALKPRRDLSQA